MHDFDDAFDVLIGHEGSYSNNPNDPGGATMYGVTERVARQWGYTGDMQALPLDTAKQIAKKLYWDKYDCDQFDIRVAFQVFDTAYNGGHPVEWLQQAAGATVDGVVGPETLAAVNALAPEIVILRFLSYRLTYLTSLPTWPTFGRGWARRVAANLLTGSG